MKSEHLELEILSKHLIMCLCYITVNCCLEPPFKCVSYPYKLVLIRFTLSDFLYGNLFTDKNTRLCYKYIMYKSQTL